MKIWIIWTLVLVCQNLSFTFVSRARNSGSLKRHMIAGLLSNGVWFASQVILFSQLMDLLTGKYGTWYAVGTGTFYTAATMLGSLVGHWVCLKTEKGTAAVGANKKYAQITNEEWGKVQEIVNIYFDYKEKVAAIQAEQITLEPKSAESCG